MLVIEPEPPQSRLYQAAEKARWELALPGGARRLIASGASSHRNAGALRLWLASDPDLAQRLIRWANSPLFNLARPLSRIDEVLAVLGRGKATGLAILGGIRDLFVPNLRIGTYTREQLWRHSMAVAAVSSMIARTCDACDDETAFMAGALHDIGILASEKVALGRFAALVDRVDSLTDTPVAEHQLGDWDHQLLGAEILCQWSFPDAICDVARYHHCPHRLKDVANQKLLCCVVVADFLCSRCGWTELGVHNVAPPPDAVFHSLGIDAQCLTILWQQLYVTLEHTRKFI